jgi:hypothetical protein
LDLRGVLTSSAAKVAAVGAEVGRGVLHGGEAAVKSVAAAAQKAAPEVRALGKQAAKATGRVALVAGKEAVRLAKTPEAKKVAKVAVLVGIGFLEKTGGPAAPILRAAGAVVGKVVSGGTAS